MKIRLKYFGIIAEERGLDSEERSFEENVSIQTIVDLLAQFSETVRNNNFRIAVNQVITTESALNDQDEIAFLPPFSGG